jgi:nicotinamide mononucleotide transporter
MLETIWQYVNNNWLEVLAVIISIIGIWLTAKEKLINWPINIVACILSIYIFYRDALFGDAALNVFFVVMCVYGWYEWVYGGKGHTALTVSKVSMKTLGILSLLTLPTCAGLGYLLTYTSSTVPYWDGITTALSLAATWMAAKKLIENWLVWIFADLLYVVMYGIKHLYMFSVLYFIFTLLAVYGYYAWKKQLTESYSV